MICLKRLEESVELIGQADKRMSPHGLIKEREEERANSGEKERTVVRKGDNEREGEGQRREA